MRPARRRLIFLSAALAAVLAVVLPLSSAPAAAVSAAGTRVGASHPQTILPAGVARFVSPGQGRCEQALRADLAAGACAAAEDDNVDLQQLAQSRADELQSSLPDGSRGRVTMGVGIGSDAEGNVRTVIGTSEPGGYLRPGVTLNPGEELAAGPGHAETSILDYMQENEIDPIWVAAGRPICGPCAVAIDQSGALPAGPLRVVP